MEIDQSLIDIFLEEISQLIQDFQKALLTLEDQFDQGAFDEVLRILHNIKGTSKALGFEVIGNFVHEVESTLIPLHRQGNQEPFGRDLSGNLLQSGDLILQAAENPDQSADSQFEKLLSQLKNIFESRSAAPPPEPRPELTLASSPIETEHETFSEEETSSCEAHMPQIINPEEKREEQQIVTLPEEEPHFLETLPSRDDFEGSDFHEEQTKEEIPLPTPPASLEAEPSTAVPQQVRSLRIPLNKLEKLERCIGEMLIQQGSVLQVVQNLPLEKRGPIFQFLKLIKEAQDMTSSLRMLPLTQMYQRLNRVARETASMINKKIKLSLEGENLEVDKVLLEKMTDPLVHIIRNAIDHGIETEEKRIAKGKDPFGQVSLKTFYEGDRLVFEIKDDGAGLDEERLLAKAEEKGILSPNQKLSREETHNLIFHPGLSSKDEATEVSGRGVGMDVVKQNVQHARGTIKIHSEKEKGSTFHISLPLTLSVLEALLIQVAEGFFFLPLSDVGEVLNYDEKKITAWSSTGQILSLREKHYSVHPLGQIVGEKKQTQPRSMIITNTQPKPIAILVDEIIGRQQIYIKPLPEELKQKKIFSGVTILKTGRLAFVLEMNQFSREQGI